MDWKGSLRNPRIFIVVWVLYQNNECSQPTLGSNETNERLGDSIRLCLPPKVSRGPEAEGLDVEQMVSKRLPWAANHVSNVFAWGANEGSIDKRRTRELESAMFEDREQGRV